MTASIAYKDLIEEAFIEPIRSVMVIDDEYPTLTNLISVIQNREQNSYKVENLDRLQNIIKMCHQEKEWVVDVFDGKTPHLDDNTNHIPDRLRHSDLVILDYHLDGNVTNDGSKAISVLKKLDNNKHFNLVVVHTKGYTDDIEAVFNEILCDFMSFPEDHIFRPAEEIHDKISEWEDEKESNIFKVNFDIKEIIKLISNKDCRKALNCSNPKHLFNSLSSDIKVVAKDLEISPLEIVRWLGAEILSKNKSKFKGYHTNDTLRWYWDSEKKINYICSGSIFITVMQKENGHLDIDIHSKLISALEKLDPSPMHLLIAKIRHHMDEIGLEQANLITQNKLAQAGWLYSLLSNSKNNESEHDKAIDIHWEQLGRASKKDLREFSKKLCNSLNIAADPEDICKRFFRVTKQDGFQALSNLNAFSCTIPPTSSHLTTGTILKLDDSSLWLCLSPACDLVPGQRANAWKERIGTDYTVIKAVRLKTAKINEANMHSNTNEYLFVKHDDGTVEAYYIALANSNPTWDVFYADNSGRLDEKYEVKLTCIRKDNDSSEKVLLTAKNYDAKVVAELRYEYALNFLQKLGNNQTRIGLGYTNQMFGVEKPIQSK
ncbi:response regulator receiver domain [Acinetobacter baumannii]